MYYGILKSNTNTGADSELQSIFATPLSIQSNQPAYVQDMLSLKRKASSQNVQRWELEVTLAKTRDAADFLIHSTVNGYATIVFVRMPQIYADSNPSNTTLSLGSNANSNVIKPVSGLTAGEFIQFTNHNKVYLVKSVSTGEAVIFPRLTHAVNQNEIVIRGGRVTMHAYYESSVKLGITFSDGVLADPGSIKLVEAL